MKFVEVVSIMKTGLARGLLLEISLRRRSFAKTPLGRGVPKHMKGRGLGPWVDVSAILGAHMVGFLVVSFAHQPTAGRPKQPQEGLVLAESESWKLTNLFKGWTSVQEPFCFLTLLHGKPPKMNLEGFSINPKRTLASSSAS